MPTWTAKDGSVINYEQHGTGDRPTLLLLPGLLGTYSQWRPFLKPLASDYQIILMDLRGHGHSTNKAKTLDPETMMYDVSDLLDSLQVQLVHIAGYSLGGYLGLMYALKEPRRVATLLMHATKFYWSQDSAAKMYKQLDPNTMAEKVPTYADQLMQEHGGRDWRILVRQAADMTGYLVNNGITERMVAHTQCPVLVSVGDRDELVPVNEALRLARLIPNGELIVLPGVRHPFQTVRPIPLLPTMKFFHRSS
ncbi:MAG: alpha/beta hydrolase [Chloroflexi bacterium]|nr:alpha/beta hydrolase [Chloroflexota bacterium]